VIGRISAIHPSTFGDTGGYGFIESTDGERLYFNVSGLQMSSVPFPSLKVGDRCRFTAIDHPSGPRAIEVFVADPNQQGLPL
jgi:cold shock CspA family protein